MLAMLEDVLAALAAAPGLAGLAVVTVDPAARGLAARYGAAVIERRRARRPYRRGRRGGAAPRRGGRGAAC